MRPRLTARMLVVASALTGASASVASGAPAAPAEQVHARLVYAPDADVERCPTERELADAVASRLGYDPFEGSPSDGREVVVRVHRRGTGIVGLLELRGPRPGQRELSSPRGDCRELLDSFAVAIAIGIDPASLTRPVGEPLAAPSTAPIGAAPPGAGAPAVIGASSPPAAEQPAVPSPRRDPLDVRVGAGPVVMFGELPATAAAIAVKVGVRWRWLEPNLEGLASVPASLGSSAGTVTASLLAASLVPCGHADVFFGCVGFTLGTLRGEGQGVATPFHGSLLYAAASARAGAELAVSRAIWLHGYLEAVAPLTRISLQLAAQDVWRMPSVAARVGAAAGIRF